MKLGILIKLAARKLRIWAEHILRVLATPTKTLCFPRKGRVGST